MMSTQCTDLSVLVKMFCKTLCCGLFNSKFWLTHAMKKDDAHTRSDEEYERYSGLSNDTVKQKAGDITNKEFEIIVFDEGNSKDEGEVLNLV